ncbi:craniofacial development protein 2-like [Anneissia japonica]|uniref:craniofacial development protein 2-like n=1 Tax=Anneissia japonica TaxID=1529436 RepID=UPI0014259180|nr:craniofacial development protein 2-like [Anneissia japonica]
MLKDCKASNLDIIFIQEMRRLGEGSVSHEGYNVYWSDMKVKHLYGVGIAFISINGIMNISPRLIAIDLMMKGLKLRIVSAYAPTEAKSLANKKSFYRELNKICHVGMDKNRKLLIQCDFNAITSICNKHSSFDGHNMHHDDTFNENGRLLIDFCNRNDLSILNTWFSHPLIHRLTWYSPDGVTRKVYDLSLSGSWIRCFVKDVRTRNSYFHSDHRLLVTKLRTPANKSARFLKKYRKIRPPDLNALSNLTVKEQIIRKIKDTLTTSVSPTQVDEKHNFLMTTLEYAKRSLPKVTNKKHPVPEDYYDDHFKFLITKRKNLRRQPRAEQSVEKMKKLNKEIKRAASKVKSRMLQDKSNEINQAKQNRKVADMWRSAKSHSKIISSNPKAITCPNLAPHFKALSLQSYFTRDF